MLCVLIRIASGDYSEFTQYTIFNIKKKNFKSSKIIPNLQLRDFSKGLKSKFETAVVNEPTVFQPTVFESAVVICHCLQKARQN